MIQRRHRMGAPAADRGAGPGALENPDLLMPPSSVAESYWLLYQQPRSAWTFETEIRLFGEKWSTMVVGLTRPSTSSFRV